MTHASRASSGLMGLTIQAKFGISDGHGKESEETVSSETNRRDHQGPNVLSDEMLAAEPSEQLLGLLLGCPHVLSLVERYMKYVRPSNLMAGRFECGF